MNFFIFCRRLFFIGLILVLRSAAYGYSAEDYYEVGLQLYNSKNFAQAAQYFTAALSLEPANTAALQGRGNCYYALGQYQEALSDYERVQSLAPSDQLSQFIQILRSKTGTAPPTVAAAPGEALGQGVALYQQKQYAAALPYFQKAVEQNPADGNASYYLGASYLGLGDAKNAALNLALSNRKQPNPSVEAYVNQLKARMTPEDQQWVDGQLTAATTAGSTSVSTPTRSEKTAIRLVPGIILLNLADFAANAEAKKAEAGFLQNSDPSFTFEGVVPTGSINLGLEGAMKLSPNFELGAVISIMPVGKATDDIHNAGSVAITDSYSILAKSGGINLRYLFGNGSFQPFLAGGLLFTSFNIDYTGHFDAPIGTAEADGNFAGMGFGGQVQLGLNWNLGDTFAVSPFLGYQQASSNDFSSKLKDTGEVVQLQVVPTSNGNVIVPVSGGKLKMPVVDNNMVLVPGTIAPSGSRPLAIDLSGVTAGIQLSISF